VRPQRRVAAALRDVGRQQQRRWADATRDRWNRLPYGPQAPRRSERLWVDPLAVQHATAYLPAASGRVVRRWPPAALVPIEEHLHVRFALRHWRDGVPWEDTGLYEYMAERIRVRGQQDGCRNDSDVVARCRRLDELHEQVGREVRLRTRQELDPAGFREDGGILMHLGPAWEPVVGDNGKHRLTVARLHRLPVVPVRVGVVHVDALPLLPALRRDPAGPAAAAG
jgi:hypothetical protein